MPIRIPVKGVMVQRDGKMKLVPLNKPFEFTTKELEDIKLRAPNALRLPVNEHAPLPPAGDPAMLAVDVKNRVPSAEEQAAQAERERQAELERERQNQEMVQRQAEERERQAKAEEAERQKQFDAAQAQAKKEAEANKGKGKSGKQNDDL